VAKVSRHVAKIVLNGVSFELKKKKEKSPSKAWAFQMKEYIFSSLFQQG
jgi:hypothetical protein